MRESDPGKATDSRPLWRARSPGRRHLISLADLDAEELRRIVERGVGHANGAPSREGPLNGHIVGIYFRKTSTRTRVAFSSGALRLGARIVPLGPNDLQENTGESVEDTTRVLSGMLDAFVARTAGSPQEMREFAAQERMAVINAMSSDEHPTQALADLTTLLQRFGYLETLRVLYVGEGNNTAVALALALSRFRDCELHLRTPTGYGLPVDRLELCRALAAGSGALVEERHTMSDLPPAADVVYTTRWQTTGTSKADPNWRLAFAPFRVDEALMARYPRAVFMHDLPAHRGEEVVSSVIDGPASISFEQAENKLHSAMAVLQWCLLPDLL